MDRVVIVGGGFGGIATATGLRRRGFSGEVVLIDRASTFVMGLRKTWHVVGASELSAGERSLTRLRGVHFRQGEVSAIDPAARSVEVAGERVSGDALVIAAGAAHAPEKVPGLVEHGINVWERRGAEKARQAIAALGTQGSGRVVIGIFGSPYACPPGPYELALLVRDRLGPGFDIEVFTPTPIALPVVGAAGSAAMVSRLESRRIGFRASAAVVNVASDRVVLANGETVTFDLLLAIPPHRVPPLLAQSGLAKEDAWVQVDPHTLLTAWPGVYAIGDCTVITLANGLAIPKAGVIAELEGDVVAEALTAPEGSHSTFAGTGLCFVEMGGQEASKIEGEFFADPPRVTLSTPSADLMKDKVAFESERLTAWFDQV